MSSSFEPSTNLDDLDNYNDTKDPRQVVVSLQPHAPPPAAPPPPLPESANNSRSSSPLSHQQQQQQQELEYGYSTYGSTTTTTTTQPPAVTIIHYYETSPASIQAKRTVPFVPPSDTRGTGGLPLPFSQQQQNQQQQSTLSSYYSKIPTTFSSFRGDATVRPNIGESNAAIGEASLKESLWKGRLLNIVACSVAIVWQVLHSIIGNVLFLHPARTVLGMYLTLFSILILSFETGLVVVGQDLVRQQFGLLYHPLGRSFLLLQMSGLAIGQGGIVDILLGIVFLGSSVYTMITFCWYPAYRRRIAAGEEEERQSILVTARDRFWANPAEATSLLQKAAMVVTDVSL
jgi:hypothetical protein